MEELDKKTLGRASVENVCVLRLKLKGKLWEANALASLIEGVHLKILPPPRPVAFEKLATPVQS